jgi:predicted enzyme related to lactoylglutathione lyase
MGERTSYAPGTFSWVDLATTDPAAAKAFYGRLFGWEAEDMPAGEGMTYTMLRLGGADVAGLSEQPEHERSQGVPPHWNCYVTVDDADAVAARAAELGGTVLAPPFDVLDSGRMAVVADPQGAVLCLWQARAQIGAKVVNVPGALTWNDLITTDPEAAARFYGDLFGWTIGRVAPGEPYWTIDNRGTANGGVMEQPPELRQAGVPPVWNAYFAVEDLDAALATAQEAGGAVVFGPMEVPSGRFAVVRDPQGAVFSLVAGQLDP